MRDSDYGPVYTVYEGNMTQVCVQLTGRLERPVNVSIDGKSIFINIGSVYKLAFFLLSLLPAHWPDRQGK